MAKVSKFVQVRPKSRGVVQAPVSSNLSKNQHFEFPDVERNRILDSENPIPFPACLVENNIGEDYDFQPMEVSVDQILWEHSSQDHRDGRNEDSSNISASMRTALYVDDSMIIVCDNDDPETKESRPYFLIAGNGRLYEMRNMGFGKVFAWKPNKPITYEVREQLGFGSNDHLPASRIKPADIVNKCPRVFRNGGIPGVSKKQAEAYSKGLLSQAEVEEINRCLKNWIDTISGKSLTETVRHNVLTNSILAVKDPSQRDVFVLGGHDDLREHLVEISKLHDPKEYPISVGNTVCPVVPQVSDGTRKGDALFGAAVRAYCDQTETNIANGLPADHIKTMNIVVATSKIRSDNFYQKLNTVKSLWTRKFDLEKFTMQASMMKGFTENIYTESEPKINLVGFINPIRQLEELGWGYKQLITYDHPVSFSTIIEGSRNNGWIDDVQMAKLFAAIERQSGATDFLNKAAASKVAA